MTASELKASVENAGHESHFFTRKTMQFFGDRMSNYGVCKARIRTRHWEGDKPVIDPAEGGN